MTSAAQVLVVDDHTLFAETLAFALRAEGLKVRLSESKTRQDLIDEVADNTPGLVLLDMDLGPDIGDGTTLVRPFVQAGARVLVVSATRRRAQIGTAVEQGAVGVVPKRSSFDDLLATCIAASKGEQVMTPDERQRILSELYAARRRTAETLAPFKELTPRERDVLHELCNGKAVAGIASEWFVSESTVRSQVRGVLSKLSVSSQLEAVALALRSGWMEELRRDRRA